MMRGGNVDVYAEKYVNAIKGAKTDKELENIINKIYSDGFGDGSNEM